VCLAALVAGAGCATHRPPHAEEARRKIAIVKVREETGARLATVDGTNVGSPKQIQLGPGQYTLGVRYANEGDAAPSRDVSFTAEAGHFYELSVAPPAVTGERFLPVLVDNSTQTQIHPKK
jgi:hypothetical protein